MHNRPALMMYFQVVATIISLLSLVVVPPATVSNPPVVATQVLSTAMAPAEKPGCYDECSDRKPSVQAPFEEKKPEVKLGMEEPPADPDNGLHNPLLASSPQWNAAQGGGPQWCPENPLRPPIA